MLLRFLYWLAVLTVSIALVVALVVWLESQDESELEGARAHSALKSAA